MKLTAQILPYKNLVPAERPRVNIKYPSQYEAQAVLDIIDALVEVYLGGSSVLTEMFDRWNAEIERVRDDIFGSDSPWAYKIVTKGRKRKRELHWDNKKWEDIEARHGAR